MWAYLKFPCISVESNLPFQDALTVAAKEFTNNFKPTKTSKYRREFKEPKESPFQAMAAHYSLWWPIGHPVSILLLPIYHPLLTQQSLTLPSFQVICRAQKKWTNG